MLPTLGLFRVVPCPYYIAGLCDRPNCCFRHCRSDVEAARREAAGLDVVEKGESDPEDADVHPSSEADKNAIIIEPPKTVNYSTFESVQSKCNGDLQDRTTGKSHIKNVNSLGSSATTNPFNLQESSLLTSNLPLTSTEGTGNLKRSIENAPDSGSGSSSKRIKLESQPQRDAVTKVEKIEKVVIKVEDDDDDVIILSSGSEGGGASPEKQIKLEKPDGSKTKKHKSRDSDRSSKDSSSDKPHRRKSDDHSRTHSSSSSSSHKHKKNRKDSSHSPSRSSRHSSDEIRRSSDSSSKSTSKHKEKSKESHSSASKRSHSSKDKKSHSSKHSSEKQKSHESKHHSNKNGSSNCSNGDSKVSKEKNKADVGKNSEEKLKLRPASFLYDDFQDDDPVNNEPDDIPDDFLFPSDEEDDPDEIAAECYQLFQDYNSEDSSVPRISLETIPEPAVHAPQETEGDHIMKKRVAHPGAFRSFLEKPLPPKRKETANEQLIRRIQLTKAAAAENSNMSAGYSNPVPSVVSNPVISGASTSSKRRIAHVSNASALVKPPQLSRTLSGLPAPSSALQPARSTNGLNSSSSTSTHVTLSQTAPKGERRMAHTPVVKNICTAGPSPTVVPDSRSKVPVVIRQKFLDQIYRECLQVYSDGETASTRALEEEKALIAKCNSKQVYSCSATNLITRLRKQYRESASDITGSGLSTAGSTKTVSHNDILAGKSGNISWSVERKTVLNPVGVPLYTRMKDYLMSAPELIDNGYPRKCSETYKGCSGLAVIKVREDSSAKRPSDDPLRKVCDRCSVSFLVTEDGFPRNKDPCTYHTGRRFGRRTRTGNSDARFNCCDGEPNSTGCCTAPCHVFTTKTPDDLRNFISAALEAGESDTMGTHPWDIIAVDCEMVYTTRGTELARATFVGQDGKILYDTYVKPSHPVLDYNTRYSGIDASMIEKTVTSISEVHLKILANLRPNSIIIGHSLENDLIALKLIHGCVIDTSLVFPHKRGLPFKRALRNLSSDYLGKIIQTGDAGHDSAEDARAALDLVLWKVRSDASKFSKRVSVSDQPK